MILTILNALVAIPKIAGYIQDLCAQIMVWYLEKQTNDTLVAIADAAAMSARAQSDEERFKAVDAWRVALSRNRVSK